MRLVRAWIPLLLALAAVSLWGYYHRAEQPRFDRVAHCLTIGSLQARIHFPEPGCEVLEIRRGAEMVFRGHSERIRFLDEPLADFTGDGRPEVALFDGLGAQSVPGLLIIELQPTVRELGRIPAHSFPQVSDGDGDGVFEVHVVDRTFAYWQYCGADSPYPQLVLSWRNGAFRGDLERMRTSPPPLDLLIARAREFRQLAVRSTRKPKPLTRRDEVVAELVHELTELVYTGHAALADRFLAETGWTQRPGEENFGQDFWNQAQTSPWWPVLLELNRGGLQYARATRLTKNSTSSGSN